MANHPSAIKKHRQDEKKRLINRMNRSKMKNKIKSLRKKILAGDKKATQQLYQQTISIIDKTSRKGVIHQRTAARYKSRLSLLLQKTDTPG